ncbi:hypothetical protein ES705_24587 [subsurface metagenome]
MNKKSKGQLVRQPIENVSATGQKWIHECAIYLVIRELVKNRREALRQCLKYMDNSKEILGGYECPIFDK